MAWEIGEKAYVTLGQPYQFTIEAYEYCVEKNGPIAIIYYDTKTSSPSKTLYSEIFKTSASIKTLYETLTDTAYKNGYCCLFVLDRRGKIQKKTEERDYFLNQIMPKTGKTKCVFATLVLLYKNNAKMIQLPQVKTPGELAAIIKKEGDSLDFDSWSGRGDWIDHQIKLPETETPPTPGSTALKTDICGAMDTPPYYQDPDTNRKFTEMFQDDGKLKSEYVEYRRLQLADVHTPETTYVLIGAYDMNNPYDFPQDIKNSISPLFRQYCDNFAEIYNTNCMDKSKGFVHLFEQGKKYRYFIFFEFSHGSPGAITINGWYTHTEVWNVFKDMRPTQRIFGMFDSCDSGSMIVGSASAGGGSAIGGAGSIKPIKSQGSDKGILEYLRAKFERRAQLMETVTGGAITASAAAAAINTRMVLWASTENYHYGWYYPTIGTIFASALINAVNSIPNGRFGWGNCTVGGGDHGGGGVFRQVQINGWYNKSSGDINECIPQCAFQPEDTDKTGINSFAQNKIFY